ncbi:MAG: protoporphyrinogen oxidase HemJ [Pseudomonadales bacterium]|jgi:putative membrane protein|nr:protoporphyrinogen oxidase HemJ [Pseudomonadales bacterium]
MLLWVKAFHIIFVVCWFAGLFYLPRLFVNHAMAEDPATIAQLKVMERKLYRFVTPFAVLAVGLGLWMLVLVPDYLKMGWMHAKIALVLLLVVYHGWCGHLLRQLRDDRSTHSHRYFRVFNELPVLVLFAVVILVVVRPF